MGKACTFFGHHDCPSSIKPKLREILIDLIENHAVNMFYVGQQGAFDAIEYAGRDGTSRPQLWCAQTV